LVLNAAAISSEMSKRKNVFNDRLRWTSVGFNIYLRGHNLKIQTDYTFKREQGKAVKNNMFQSQLQLDF